MSDTSRIVPVLRRAAVVIGVNNTGGLTPLRAAVSGAKEFADWLRQDGYIIEDEDCLTDDTEPVTVHRVKKSVLKHANGNLDQLVIYFAGHGYLIGTSEIWLLSGAPTDPDEAIDLNFSAELARSTGIPSVVFISDACRSNPPTMVGARVQGSSIFPNMSNGSVDVSVDRFFATKPGDPALELDVGRARTAYSGLFTEMLCRAHRDPDQSLMRTISLKGQDFMVVPSRRLKEVLPARVNEAAQERSVRLLQSPQLRLECGEEGFIAHAVFSKIVEQPRPMEPSAETASASQFGRSRGRPRGLDPAPVRGGVAGHGIDTSRKIGRIKAADKAERFETQTGIQVSGTGVADVFAPEFSVTRDFDVPGAPGGPAGSVRIRLGAQADPYQRPDRAGSALVQFHDGGGAVVAVLPGYIASMLVEDGRVVNISYVPSEGSNVWLQYRTVGKEVEALRSKAAVAARSGDLAPGRDEARRFGDTVRKLKKFDPTLGLYAALAYAEIGLRREVTSIQRLMQRDIEAVLFDVALLAGSLEDGPATDSLPVVPFCPMLSQTWSFLRPLGIRLDPLLSEAFFARRPSLWTTLSPDSVLSIRRAMEMGRLR